MKRNELFKIFDHKIKIKYEFGFAEVTLEGAVTRMLLDRAFLQVIESSHFRHNMNALYDYSNAYSDLTMQEIEEYAQYVEMHTRERGSDYKLALVANDTLNIALLEVYKLLVSKTAVEVEVFSNKDKAIQWITE